MNLLFPQFQYSPSVDEGLYSKRGVSAQKEEVHAAIKNLYMGWYPHAFCTVYPDFLGGTDTFVTIIHDDGACTKSARSSLSGKTTGAKSV